MNCPESQALIQQRMDGAACAGGEELARHCSQCATCLEMLSASTVLLDGLRKLPKQEVPASLTTKIVASILGDREKRRVEMRRRVVLTMSLAASVMLLLLLGYYWTPRTAQDGPKRKNEDIARDQPKYQAPAPRPPDELSKDKTPGDVLQRALEATRDHAQVVLAAASLEGVSRLPMAELPVLDPGVREAGQDLSDGVRVVTSGTRRALDFFARELPMPTTLAKGD